MPGRNSSSSHQHSHTRLLWHVTVFNPPDPGHVAGDTRHAGHALRSSQQWQWEVRGGGGDDASHYKICGMISSLMESEPTIRHGHQQICLMKVDGFWCSEMKIRFSQLHTLMSRLLIVNQLEKLEAAKAA